MSDHRLGSWTVLLVLLVLDAGCVLAQADDRLAAVEALLVKGKNEEALSAAKKAQRELQAKGDRRGEALSLLFLASAEWETGRLDTAATDFAQSAEMLEAVGDIFSAWVATGQQGNVERLRGHPSEALSHFERSLSLIQKLAVSSEPLPSETLSYIGMPQAEAERPHVLRLAQAMSTAGIVGSLLDSNQLERAEKELARLVELARPLGGALDREIAVRRGELRQKQGAFDEARKIFIGLWGDTASSPLREKLSILKSLTEIELSSGRLKEALDWNDKALVLLRSAGGDEQLASLLLRAQILDRSHRQVEAEKILVEALAVAKKSRSKPQQALIHKTLGRMGFDAERREQAAAHFEAAAHLFHAMGNSEQEAMTWVYLYQIYSQLDSRASADTALTTLRELSTSSGSRLVEALADFITTLQQAQSNKADLSAAREKMAKLRSLPELQEGWQAQEGQKFFAQITSIEKSFGEAPAPPSVPDASKAESLIGDPSFHEILSAIDLLRRNKFAAVRKVVSTSLARNPDRDLEVPLLVLMAAADTGEGNGRGAILHLKRAVEKIEQGAADARVPEFLEGYLGNREQIYSMLIQLLAALGPTDEAFEYAERARARAFLQGLGNPGVKPRRGADPELVREAEALRQEIFDVERRMISVEGGAREEPSRELEKKRDRYQSLLVRLKVTDPAQSSQVRVEPQRVPVIREQLDNETTLVSYYISSPIQAQAWVLDKKILQHVALPIDPADLTGAVCWAEQIGHRIGGRGVERLPSPCGGKMASAEELYQKLIAPLRPYIHHRRLIIVPHSELHYLPFAALRDPQTGRYLIQDFTLTYAPSASVLGFLHSKETPVEGKALVLGSPEEHDPRFGPLPAARQEAEAVGRLLGTPPLFGAQALEGRLYGLAGKIDLLHIAAHGFYESRNPFFSRIVLAPDKEHDGKLEVHEILSDLDLSGVNLVVLSACETARGERSRGDEVTGLTRAFLYAGSPGAVSTLWNIDDEASAVLMQDFYRRLLSGIPVADALREAQLRLLREGDYQDPYFWAAFSLTGDPQGRWKSADIVASRKAKGPS